MELIKKIAAMLLALCMLCACAMAEEAAPAEEELEAAEIVELNADDVLCVLNGQNITWADVEVNYNALVQSYGDSYDMTLAENVDLFRAVALDETVTVELLLQKAAELGLDQLTDEEKAQIIATADADWENGVASYIGAMYPDLDQTDEAAVAAARAEAEAYYGALGYNPDSLHEMYLESEIMNRVMTMMTQDATVSDEDVQAHYEELVAADKELYENDLAAYVEYNAYVDTMAMYSLYLYGVESDLHYAWYRPEGMRGVKHILIPVDDELMNDWAEKKAALEEQENAEEGTVIENYVTQEMVDEAYAAILASKADDIEAISRKLTEGFTFDEMIDLYGVNADGTPSDPGMTTEPYKSEGYEVCAYSTNYVQAFTDAAMSVTEVGDVSAPYVSDYGIHIVKYLRDIPAGPIELTDADRTAIYDELLQTKQNELYSQNLDQWMSEATIEYVGPVSPLN